MKKVILFSIGFLSLFFAKATHNRAGEITYRHLSGLTYEISATIFADPNSPAISRREIEVDWGDNTGKDSLNVFQEFDVIPGYVRKRIWRAQHTFPGPGNYAISVTDPNRNGGVDNIDNSSAVPFYVSSTLRIFPINGIYNSSPVLLNDPIDDACIGQTFIHNPGAVDPDGDSLAYEISPSFGINGSIAPGFTFPPTSNRLFVNPLSGDLVWENPSEIGIYNVALRIKEYRNGVFIGDVLRDLQIVVYAGCNNSPPIISVNRSTCLEAGTTFNLPVRGLDPNAVDQVTLAFTGELFGTDIPNQAVVNYGPVSNPTNASIIWNTICDNIRPNPYITSIKATDNGFIRGSTNLSSFETAQVRVIGPAVKNFTAQAQGREIILNWDVSSCANAVGYKIYRRIDSSGFVPGSCQIGVPASAGHTLIDQSNDPNLSSYVDTDKELGLVPGQKYCYLITARFPQGDEGYASSEVCAEIQKVVPVMTEVSIELTSATIGEINLSWSPPDSLDSLVFPSPYRYLIYKQEPAGAILIDSTSSINDTIYRHSNVNTSDMPSSYLVELYSLGSGRVLVSKSAPASSQFLSIVAKDNQLDLSWTGAVPWSNDSFAIFRKVPSGANVFQKIATTFSTNFSDNNLSNGRSYCYYIESMGSYKRISAKKPIINKSQEHCAIPNDEEPPCSPVISVQSDCNFNQLSLTWTNPNLSCDLKDAVAYRIYRSPARDGKYSLLDTIQDINNTSYAASLESIAGCYVIASVDSVGNESAFSAASCVDYCPLYELPNIFTPNGDGVNDLFVPIENPKFRYVKSIELKVFNRWSTLVFETTKPEINWDGKHLVEKELVPDGIYFYTCIVNELSLEGIKPRLIKGTITLIDGQANNFK